MKLLSFGEDEGAAEDEPVIFKKKPIVRPDCERICLPVRSQQQGSDLFLFD